MDPLIELSDNINSVDITDSSLDILCTDTNDINEDEVGTIGKLVGMILHKKSLKTIFGHKYFRHKFHQNIDIFHVKISTASNFGSNLV